MPSSLSLQVITPVSVLLSATGVARIRVNLTDGLLGIWPGHAPLLAATVDAPLYYEDETGAHTLHLAGGILQIKSDSVTLFTPGLQTEADTQPISNDAFPRLTNALLTQLTAHSEGTG